MRTGLTKKQKITNIYFTEADDLIEVCTYNTDLKNGWQHSQRNIPPNAASWMTMEMVV